MLLQERAQRTYLTEQELFANKELDPTLQVDSSRFCSSICIKLTSFMQLIPAVFDACNFVV